MEIDSYKEKEVPQGPQRLSSLKSLKIQNPPTYTEFSLLQPSEMASLSNSR